MNKALLEELKQLIASRRVLLIVGSGVSRAAVTDAEGHSPECASWAGLLRSGVSHVFGQSVGDDRTARWARRTREAIDDGDASDYVRIADEIVQRLGGVQHGEFARWLRESVGALRAHDSRILEAVRALGVQIATTNYDELLSTSELPPVTWRDRNEVERIVRGESRGVLHLNGVWRRPDTIVFGMQSYATIRSDEHAQTVLRALRLTHSLVFIGCGATTDDPNLGALLSWTKETFAGSESRHFRLSTEAEAESDRRRHAPEERVFVIPYGKDFEALPSFLEALAPARPSSGPTSSTRRTKSSAPEPAPISEPTCPRVVLIGPLFGIAGESREQFIACLRSGWSQLNVDRFLSKVDVDARLRMNTLLRHDLVLDMSPARTFERQISIGSPDVSDPASFIPVDRPAIWFASPTRELENPLAINSAALAALLGTDGESDSTSSVRKRLVELGTVSGVLMIGFEPDHVQTLRGVIRTSDSVKSIPLYSADPFDAHVRDVRPAPPVWTQAAQSSNLADYRRAVRIAHGAVRLFGEDRPRAIQDVFVRMDIVVDDVREPPKAKQARGDRPSEPDGSASKEEAGSKEAELRPEEGSPIEDQDQLDEDLEARRRIAHMFRTEVTLKSADKLLELSNRILLWGEAGTGKTTLLKWLACEASEQIPLLVRAHDLVEHRHLSDPVRVVVRAALRRVGLDPDDALLTSQIEGAIQCGNARLFIDSVDEQSPVSRQAFFEWLRGAGSLAQVPTVVASRPLIGNHTGLHRLRHVRLHGLRRGGAKRFVRAYFPSAEWGLDLVRRLESLPDGADWVRVPVLLALAASLYREGRQIPKDTIELYERAVDSAIQRALKRLGLDYGREKPRLRRLLENLARRTIVDGASPFETVTDVRGLDDDVVREEVRATGLFIEVGRTYAFAHLTLGEYLSACAVGHDIESTFERARVKQQAIDSEWLPMAIAKHDAGERVMSSILEATNEGKGIVEFQLLLRAIRYSGPVVARFLTAHAQAVVDAVFRHLLPDSGRFSDPERKTARYAESAFRVVVAHSDRGSINLPAIPKIDGETGETVARLTLVLDDRSTRPNRVLARRSGAAWVSTLLASRWTSARIVDDSRGEPNPQVRAAAARALSGDEGSRAQLRDLLKDGHPQVRAAAARALSGDEGSRAQLLDLLKDDDSDVRASAAIALSGDEGSRAQLLDLLKADDSDVRASAAIALSGDEGSRAQLLDLLKDDDSDVRTAAAIALSGDEGSRAQLLDLLKDDDSDVRASAAFALSGDEGSRAQLLDLLKDDERQVRAVAAFALSGDGGTGAQLLDLLKGDDSDVRAAAARAFSGDERSRAQLLDLLKDDYSEVRASAAIALSGDEGSRAQLRDLLKADEGHVRAAAARALTGDEGSRAQLLDLLKDDDLDVRAAAARALSGDEGSRAQLRDLLKADEGHVRAAAARALSGDEGSRAQLLDLLKDDEWQVRAAAARALSGDEGTRAQLRDLLKDGHPSVRAAAARALSGDEGTRAQLRDLLKADEWQVRAAAARALSGDEGTRAQLLDLLKDDDSDVRAAAARALSGDEGSRAQLLDLLKAGPPSVRAAAASALSGDEGSRAQLLELVKADEWQVRAAAARALSGDEGTRAQLRDLLKDGHPQVRAAAARALSGDEGTRAQLRELLKAGDSDVRAAAASALSGDESSRAQLRELLKADEWQVRAAAASALSGDESSRAQLRELLKADEWQVRAAGASALSGDEGSRAQLLELLKDDDSDVRAAAARALSGDSDKQVRVELARALCIEPSLYVRSTMEMSLAASTNPSEVRRVDSADLSRWRAGLRAVGFDPKPTLPVQATDAGDETRIADHVRRPRPMVIDPESDLGAAWIGWCLGRLGATAQPRPEPVRWVGSVRQPTPDTYILHLAMRSERLRVERDVCPLHNQLELMRVLRHAVTRSPLVFWMVCAEVDIDLIELPTLLPGEARFGPVLYGYRVAELPTKVSDPMDLYLSADASIAFSRMTPPDQTKWFDKLRAYAIDPETDPFALVLIAKNLASVLPADLKASIGDRLPKSSSMMVQFLEDARESVGAVRADAVDSVKSDLRGTAPSGSSELIECGERIIAARTHLEASPPDVPQAIVQLRWLLERVQSLAPQDIGAIVRLIERAGDRARHSPEPRVLCVTLQEIALALRNHVQDHEPVTVLDRSVFLMRQFLENVKEE